MEDFDKFCKGIFIGVIIVISIVCAVNITKYYHTKNNNIIEKERNAYKERMGQIKNEANGLIIEKNLLLDEIIILENKIKKLEEKLLAKEEERQETNNLRASK